MKTLLAIVTIALLLAGTLQTACAQTETGNWLLSGSGSFQHSKADPGGKNTTINFSPKAGIFVINNLAIGLMPSFGYSHDSYSDVNLTDTKSYTLSIGPFVRYYFPVSPVVKLFAEGSFTYGRKILRPKSAFNDYDIYNWSIGPGAAFFITPSVSLDAAVKYGQTTSKAAVKQRTNLTEVQLGFSIYLK